MTTFYIYHFLSIEPDKGEYIIISEDDWSPEEITENCRPDFKYQGRITCEAVSTSPYESVSYLPLNGELSA